MADRIVDARGMACPLPVVNAKQAVEEMKAGEILDVLVDNEIAVQNLTRFAGYKGFEVSSEMKAEKEYAVTIHVGEAKAEMPEEEIEDMECDCQEDSIKKGMVVVLSANVMGTGDEKLGKALMKAFVFAVTKQDALPETILCYNTGAYLTCEDSDSLEDFKILEAEGVNIMTCGTCLDFYQIKDKLQVGGITNMYTIVEKLTEASKVIKP